MGICEGKCFIKPLTVTKLKRKGEVSWVEVSGIIFGVSGENDNGRRVVEICAERDCV